MLRLCQLTIKRRFIISLLAVCVAVSVLPGAAFAKESGGQTKELESAGESTGENAPEDGAMPTGASTGPGEGAAAGGGAQSVGGNGILPVGPGTALGKETPKPTEASGGKGETSTDPEASGGKRETPGATEASGGRGETPKPTEASGEGKETPRVPETSETPKPTEASGEEGGPPGDPEPTGEEGEPSGDPEPTGEEGGPSGVPLGVEGDGNLSGEEPGPVETEGVVSGEPETDKAEGEAPAGEAAVDTEGSVSGNDAGESPGAVAVTKKPGKTTKQRVEVAKEILLDKEQRKTFFDEHPWVLILLKMILIGLITYLVANISKKMWRRNPKNSTFLFRRFIFNIVQVFIYLAGCLLAIAQIPMLSKVVQTLLAGSGILALAISLSAQESLKSILSGLFLTIFKPFEVGDRVTLVNNKITGIIEDITLRHTIIKTFTNTRIVIPNATINSEIIENSNIVDARASAFVDVWVAYESDLDKAMKIMEDIIGNHPLYLDVREEQDKETVPKVNVFVRELGDSGVALRASMWTKTVNENFIACSEIRLQIKKAFDAAGIEIPYTKYTILQQKPK